VQTWPQAPQFNESLLMVVSQPLAALPSQLAKPLAQAKPQVPWTQVVMAFGTAAQQVTLLPFLHSIVVLGQPEQTVMQ
jgi:hypothetical protein